MKRKLVAIALVMLMLFCSATSALAASNIKISINGNEMDFYPAAYMASNTTMVPMRAIFEAFGADVDYNATNQKIIASKGDTTIELVLGNKTAQKNGQSITLDAPATTKNGSTMVPLRFIAEALQANVDWDNASQTVIITTDEETAAEINKKFGWRNAYKDFVLNGKYLLNGQDYSNLLEHYVSLYDLDNDGIPELIIDNGYDTRVESWAYIYTYNGNIEYLGIGPAIAFYVQNASYEYSGLWGSYNMSPDVSWTYYWKVGNELQKETAYWEINNFESTTIERKTDDLALFEESRKGKARLLGGSISEIKKMGWSAFVEKALSR